MLNYIDNINESENNIADLNETRKHVSSAIRKKLNKVDAYELGEIHSGRKYINWNKENVSFQFNFRYNMVKSENDFLHYHL